MGLSFDEQHPMPVYRPPEQTKFYNNWVGGKLRKAMKTGQFGTGGAWDTLGNQITAMNNQKDESKFYMNAHMNRTVREDDSVVRDAMGGMLDHSFAVAKDNAEMQDRVNKGQNKQSAMLLGAQMGAGSLQSGLQLNNMIGNAHNQSYGMDLQMWELMNKTGPSTIASAINAGSPYIGRAMAQRGFAMGMKGGSVYA